MAATFVTFRASASRRSVCTLHGRASGAPRDRSMRLSQSAKHCRETPCQPLRTAIPRRAGQAVASSRVERRPCWHGFLVVTGERPEGRGIH